MYRELVDLAVRELEASSADLDGADREAALVREAGKRRQALDREGSSHEVATAIAAQVAYDAVLVSLSRLLRLDCDRAGFAVPRATRLRLEAALREQGILLGSPPASAASGT